MRNFSFLAIIIGFVILYGCNEPIGSNLQGAKPAESQTTAQQATANSTAVQTTNFKFQSISWSLPEVEWSAATQMISKQSVSELSRYYEYGKLAYSPYGNIVSIDQALQITGVRVGRDTYTTQNVVWYSYTTTGNRIGNGIMLILGDYTPQELQGMVLKLNDQKDCRCSGKDICKPILFGGCFKDAECEGVDAPCQPQPEDCIPCQASKPKIGKRFDEPNGKLNIPTGNLRKIRR